MLTAFKILKKFHFKIQNFHKFWDALFIEHCTLDYIVIHTQLLRCDI